MLIGTRVAVGVPYTYIRPAGIYGYEDVETDEVRHCYTEATGTVSAKCMKDYMYQITLDEPLSGDVKFVYRRSSNIRILTDRELYPIENKY